MRRHKPAPASGGSDARARRWHFLAKLTIRLQFVVMLVMHRAEYGDGRLEVDPRATPDRTRGAHTPV